MPAPWRGLTHNQRVIQVFDYTRHTIRPGSVLTIDKNPLVPPSAAFSPNPQRLGPDAGTVGVGKSLGSVVQKDITRERVPPAVRLKTAAMIDLLRTFRIFMSKRGQLRIFQCSLIRRCTRPRCCDLKMCATDPSVPIVLRCEFAEYSQIRVIYLSQIGD